MKRFVLLFGAIFLTTTAFGATIDTGTAPWTCAAANPTPCAGNVPANLGTNPAIWIGAVGGASWIGPNANSSPSNADANTWPLPGTYIYTLDLAALGSGFVSFSNLRIATDNGGSVDICNGMSCTQIYNNPGPIGFGAVSSIPNGLLNGATSIRVTIVNDNLASAPQGRSPSGFFLDGDVNVPEPSTYAMFGIGALGILAARLRRKV